MDESVIRQIEREGADALLDAGVSVPLKALRLPFLKKPFEIRVTMRRPCLAGQIRIACIYLNMGVTTEDMWKFTREEEMRFLAEHGKDIGRMISCTICRGWWSRHLLSGLCTWFVLNWMDNKYLLSCMKKFVSLMGTDPFIPIIRSAERTNPMRLRLSREKKGS